MCPENRSDLSQQIRAIVVEDEQEIREFLVSQLEENNIRTVGLPSGEGLQQELRKFQPNVILMDQRMPGKSGRELVKEIRKMVEFSEVPIIMVTGLGSEQEKVDSFSEGVDDYITKPFSIRELIARVQALVRRAATSHRSTQTKISIKDLSVDLVAFEATLRGQELPLTLTEFKILAELLNQVGEVLTRDRLRERALGNLGVTDRTIDVHMASLRKKLGDMGDTIETVRGVGYKIMNKSI
jgi:DNA-binding response OmpR family regulator